NLYMVLHAGYVPAILEPMLRLARARSVRAVVFPVIAAEEFEEGPGLLADPDTGALAEAPPDRVARLNDHLRDCVELGRHWGVPVEPLVVADHRADIETLLPLLASL